MFLLLVHLRELCFPRDVSSSHVYLHSLEVELDNPLTKGRNKGKIGITYYVSVYVSCSMLVLRVISLGHDFSWPNIVHT